MIPSTAQPGLIELKVQKLHQLFNSMDPSPFHERDLDDDAEEFIVSWAREHHRTTPLKLLVHLEQHPEEGDAQKIVTDSMHHFFGYKADLNRRELRQLLREGWISLLIGLVFLFACVLTAQKLTRYAGEDWKDLTKEGLTILGWVAMWHPLEIYLYLWWPRWSLGQVYRKLSVIPVEVRVTSL